MSDRLYRPGVSAPEVFGTSHERALTTKLGKGIHRGAPTHINPLGLYIPLSTACIENGLREGPEPYLAPYAPLTDDQLGRCRTCPDIYTGNEPYPAVAGLVYGGIYEYVLANRRFSQLERENFPDMNMVWFGAYISAALQQEIAKLVLYRYANASINDIWRVIRASFPSTAGYLQLLCNDDALAIEKGLELLPPEDPDNNDEYIPATLELKTQLYTGKGRYREIPLFAEIVIGNYGDIPLSETGCGGRYVRYKGKTLPELLWHRINRVAANMPWTMSLLRDNMG